MNNIKRTRVRKACGIFAAIRFIKRGRIPKRTLFYLRQLLQRPTKNNSKARFLKAYAPEKRKILAYIRSLYKSLNDHEQRAEPITDVDIQIVKAELRDMKKFRSEKEAVIPPLKKKPIKFVF